MINLKKVLADDITAGIEAAVTAGEMKALSSIPSVVVEHPENPEHGDYASPIALGLAKQVGLPPMEVVATAAKHMPKKEYIIYRENKRPFLSTRKVLLIGQRLQVSGRFGVARERGSRGVAGSGR